MLHISGLPVVRPWMTFLKSLYLQNYAPDLCAVFTELVVGLFNKSYFQPDLGHLGSHWQVPREECQNLRKVTIRSRSFISQKVCLTGFNNVSSRYQLLPRVYEAIDCDDCHARVFALLVVFSFCADFEFAIHFTPTKSKINAIKLTRFHRPHDT